MLHQTVHAPDPTNGSSTSATNTMNSGTPPIVIPLQRETRGALSEMHWIYRTATPPPGSELPNLIPTNHSSISARNPRCPLRNALDLQDGCTTSRHYCSRRSGTDDTNTTRKFHPRRKHQIRNSNISAILVYVRPVSRYQVPGIQNFSVTTFPEQMKLYEIPCPSYTRKFIPLQAFHDPLNESVPFR